MKSWCQSAFGVYSNILQRKSAPTGTFYRVEKVLLFLWFRIPLIMSFRMFEIWLSLSLFHWRGSNRCWCVICVKHLLCFLCTLPSMHILHIVMMSYWYAHAPWPRSHPQTLLDADWLYTTPTRLLICVNMAFCKIIRGASGQLQIQVNWGDNSNPSHLLFEEIFRSVKLARCFRFNRRQNQA